MAQIKSVKKKFFEVSVPLTAAKVHVYGHSIEQFEGQIVKVDLTKSLRGKSLELRAKIKNNNGTLESTPIALELLSSYLRKAIRKGTDYVEDSFELDAKDAKLRIKPFLLTRRRVSRAIRNELRENARKFIEGHCKVRSAEEIFSDVTANKIQKELSHKLKKVYPLAFCEIRIIEIVPEKKIAEAGKQ
jgi:ribosomal protein S3AE